MRFTLPSPSMVVAIIALVVALGGTATAARTLITSSSQVRAGSITGSDVRNSSLTGVDVKNRSLRGGDLRDGTITSRQLKDGTVGLDQLDTQVKRAMTPAAGGEGFTANEVVRRKGPEDVAPGTKVVATLKGLAPGTYVITAKTTMSPAVPSGDLLSELLKSNKTASAECVLRTGGDQDNARAVIATPYALTPQTLNLQQTRTIDAPVDVQLDCGSAQIRWSASDSSIIALRLQGSSRSDVTE